MADIEYYDEPASRYDTEGATAASGMSIIVNWIGALMSVALIVGLAIWAWQLTVRDVSGVPVIRALEGPMRVAPENPGGTVADHQGLAVNRITEGAEAAPAADRIVLAPAPLDIEEIDLSSASLPADSTAPADAAGEETLALIDRLLEEATPLEPLEPAAEAEAVAAGNPVDAAVAEALAAAPRPLIDVIPATIPGVSRSLRPLSRPEEVVLVASLSPAAPAAAQPAAASVAELDPEGLATGTRLVQLGAFDDAETAREEWVRLARLYPDFFRDKDRVVQRAVSGGRAFFRLRAHGFDDLSDARRFCTALNAQGAPCIPVTVR
ncbi:SPOR domain-containing protein [Nioella ostreopsis]|uniref:SPOR domain-containing protein n=1 Tax=Nioella ostreopsis TaxID=2448479 RepID=UPI000FDBEFD5|nr:SPOR domain-containing protein [Nioella ostreopsis]